MAAQNRKTYGKRPTRTADFSSTFISSTPPHASSSSTILLSSSVLPPSSPPPPAPKLARPIVKNQMTLPSSSSFLPSSSPPKVDDRQVRRDGKQKLPTSLETAIPELLVVTSSSPAKRDAGREELNTSSVLRDCGITGSSPPRGDGSKGIEKVTSLETALAELTVKDDDEDVLPVLEEHHVVSPRRARRQRQAKQGRAEEITVKDEKPKGRPRRAAAVGKENEPPSSTDHNKKDDKPQEPQQRALRGRTVKTQPLHTPGNLVKPDFSYAASLLRVCEDPDTDTASSLADLEPLSFQPWADTVSDFYTVHKIAEASYGEVYKLRLRPEVPGAGKTICRESVLKIIPLRPPHEPPVKCKFNVMSDVSDVVGEVELLKRMTEIPGFTCFRGANVMRGPLPKQWVAAWRAYRAERKANQKEAPVFPDPGRKGSYAGDAQLWCVIEMADAGKDLEKLLEDADSGLKDGAIGAWDVFWGVALAVAKGEEAAEFEHRDLHVGNICIKYGDVTREAETRNVGRSGIRTTLIDYTLSRARMEDEEDAEEARVAFFDLEKDQAIFEGEGEYQYDVYRLMRDEVMSSSNEPSTSWRAYHPRTNALWLHYLLTMLCTHLSSVYNSSNSSEELEREYYKRLQRLTNALDPKRRKKGFVGYLASAKDVVGYALEHGWLDERDIVECDYDDVE